MKSMFTKTKARRVAMLLLVAVMTMTAQTAQAQSNPTTYDELVTAINDVTAGGTVTLGGDIDLGSLGSSNGIEIETDANFTLDLNGHVLKGSTTNAVIYVKDGTTLAITDGAGGGSIVNEHTSEGCAVKNSGTVTISGGTFSGRSGLYNCSGGTANVGACTIKGCDNGILNESTLNLTALPTFGSGTDANDSDIKLYTPYKIITFSADIAAAPANPIVVSYYDFDPPVTFTSGYATHCAGIDPADMFTYYGGATTNIIATLDGDEVQFMLIPVPYLDENGQEQTLDDYNVIGASQTFYSDWYVVTRDVTLSSLSFSDDAYIILCDGAKLTVKDNNVRGDITPGNDRSITIYGQPAGSGAIEAGAIKVNTSKSIGANFTLCGGNLDINRLEACNIYIYDGSITATTANNKTAIYSGALTQINGGNVTVTANGCNGIESAGEMVDIRGGQVTVTATGDNCNGIQADGGEIEISGGQVTANATGTNSYGMRGYASSEIYLGWTNATDFITASSYYVENNEIGIASGKTMSNGSEILSGTIYDVNNGDPIGDLAAIAGKILRPAVKITLPTGITATGTNVFTQTDGTYAVPGATVTLGATGYTLSDVSSSNVTITENNGVYTFEMPASDVTVTATVSIPYIFADGTTAYCADFTELNNTMTTLSAGWYVVNSNVTVDGRIDLKGDTNLILGDGYTLDVKGIYIPQGSTLIIYAQSDGLTAGQIVSNPSDGAAIGGKSGNDNGNIVIYGGIIEAAGAEHCAGIGSNDGQTGGYITIYGGTVTAKGGADAAAIGGGRNCSGGTITIYGGNITANGPTDSDTCENGAGIGGGDGGDGGTITIYGGTITTYSRDGAGIGGGDDGNGGTITINGGTITSEKVDQGQGARIGGGCDAVPGSITINGGAITTVGGKGAGIGGGKGNKANGTVSINGGVINASGTYGIGAGQEGADVAITLGWTNASDCITASSYNGSVTIADGHAMIVEGTDSYSGTLDDTQTAAIAGKTLIPAPGGTCGASGDEDGVTWVYDVSTKTLTISGTGAMADIAYDAEQPWEIVKTEMTSVVIGNGVTNIGNNAFKGCTSLETVSIGSGVASKGSYAFDNCTSLTTITVDAENANYSSEDGVLFNKNKTTLLLCPPGKSGTYIIPSSVTSVGDGSFSGCSSLTEVIIQQGVKTIGYSSFGGCSGLTTISIPNSVTTINSGAFSYCTSVATLQLGSGLTTINPGVFNGLTSLTSLTIGNGVTTIYDGSFSGCTSLKYLTIGDGVTTITTGIFNGCTNLETIEFGAGLTTINSGCFDGFSKLEEVTFKDGTNPLTIYSAAFRGCTSLETVTLSANVTSVGTNAFIGCTSLASVDLKGPATIGDAAFPLNATVKIADCVYLNNGTEVLGGAITDMSKLNGKVLALYDHYVVKTTDSDITVGRHAVSEADFTLDNNGDGTDDAYYFVADEGDELTLGYTGDVYDDEIVVYMVRDANRKDITASVMSGSTLTMPAGNVTVMASKADLSGDCGTDGHEEDVTWSYDPATTTLTISGSGEMGDNPWENVLKYIITKVVIGDGVTTIVRRAFRNHAALTDVTIGSGVVTIEENAFDGCAALTGVTIPDGVTTINNDVFRDCSSLTSIDIPKSVTEIEGNIFSGCTSLTGIAVDPANMDYKNDDRGALLSKDGKDFIIYPIGNTATSYDIPYGVTSIEGSAFIGSTALTALTIPYGVTRIKKSAFEGCSGLTSIIIPASVKNIAVDAFLECTSMKDVYCYVIDPSALSWSDRHCDDFKKDKDQTTCHVFDKDAFNARWATGGGDDVCVTFVGDLATIPFNLTELEGVSHLAALAGKTLPVQFSRTYTTGSGANKASTVCLPFDFDKPDTETVGTFYTFGGVSDDTGEYVVTMNEVTDATLTAGTPYMFVPKTSDKLTQGNAAFTVPVEGFAGASSATNGSWQFKGTFEKKTWESGQKNLYGFAGKEYYLSNGSQIASDDIGSFRRFDYGTCAAFRCYLLAPESSGARGVSKAGSLPETLKVRLVKADGKTTAIGTLDTRTGEVEFGDDWYDLNGRRLDVKPTAKGVYINNGKKIVIKN